MRIYLIRHAEPYYPDDSLTPAGHREAQALAAHLAEIGLDEIYASPRGRAQLTASYTAAKLGLQIQTEPWANELDGLYSEEYQQVLWDLDSTQLRGPEVLGQLSEWSHIHPLDHPRLAEHLCRIQEGSDDFLRRQGFIREGSSYKVVAENHKRIALFAHLGFGLTWLALLLEIPLPLMWAGFFLHPSSVTTLLFDERTPGMAAPRILALGDISHLYRAGVTPSRAGIIANYD